MLIVLKVIVGDVFNLSFFSRKSEKHNKLTVQLRTTAPNGLLAWSNQGGTTAKGDFFAVAVVDGFPELSFKLGKRETVTTVKAKVSNIFT
jgi:agrin